MSGSAPQPFTSGPEAAPPAPPAVAAANGSTRSSGCPPHVLEAIYGKQQNKKEQLERSLHRWWTEYADRKNDEKEEYVADSLLYDRRHLPRTAPAPECVARLAAEEAAAAAASAAGQQQQGELAGRGAAGQTAGQQPAAGAAAQPPGAAPP